MLEKTSREKESVQNTMRTWGEERETEARPLKVSRRD